MSAIKLRNTLLSVLIILLAANIVMSATTTPSHLWSQSPNRSEPRKGYDELRADAILTTSYVVCTNISNLKNYTSLILMFDLTKGSLTSFEFKVWQSWDSVNWFQEPTESNAGGVITVEPAYYYFVFGADTDPEWYVLLPIHGKYLKVEVKGTGTVTGSSCGVEIMGAY